MSSINTLSNSNAAFTPPNRVATQAIPQPAARPTLAQATAGLLPANDTPFDAVLLNGTPSASAAPNQDAFTKFYAYPPNQAGQSPYDNNQQQQQPDYATYFHQWHHTLQNAQRVQFFPVEMNQLVQQAGAAGFHRII